MFGFHWKVMAKWGKVYIGFALFQNCVCVLIAADVLLLLPSVGLSIWSNYNFGCQRWQIFVEQTYWLPTFFDKTFEDSKKKMWMKTEKSVIWLWKNDAGDFNWHIKNKLWIVNGREMWPKYATLASNTSRICQTVLDAHRVENTIISTSLPLFFPQFRLHTDKIHKHFIPQSIAPTRHQQTHTLTRRQNEMPSWSI